MKFSKMQPRLFRMFLIGQTMLFTQTGYANISFNSSTTVSYSINSITNLTAANPGDLTALAVSGSFQQLSDAFSSSALTTGDGSYLAVNPAIISAPVQTVFSNTFSVSGSSAAYGTVDTLQTGLYSLDFINSGPDSYRIDVTLNYLLNATAAGIFANSSIQLDYWDSLNTLADTQDYVSVGTFPAFAYDNQSTTGLYDLIFTLAPGAANSFIVQSAVTASLDSTSYSAVPLPAATWCFLGGLMSILGLMKRKK